MQVVKNYLYNIFYQTFVLIVPLVTTPYLARVLGPKGVGINSFTNSVIQYFILFGSIGIDLYGNRQIAFVRDNKEKLAKSFYEIFILRIITIFLSYLTFLFFLFWANQFKIYYLAQSISIIAAAFDISWFFMGVENFAVTVFRNFIIKIITIISIFAFVKNYSNLGLYILILSISLLIGNITLFPSLHKYIGKINVHRLEIIHHLKPSLLLFIPQIATQIYLVLNKTMLGLMVSVTAAGYFDQSDKIIKIILAIVTATGTVMLPHVANAFSRGDYEITRKYLYNSFSFVTALSIPMALGLMAIAPKLIPLFLTQRFDKVIPIMVIESLVIWLIAWSNAIGTQYLLPTNQSKAYSISVIIGSLVNLTINIPLIAWLGASGAAIATVISEAMVTFYQLLVIRKQIDYKKLFLEMYKYLVSGLFMFIIVYTLNIELPVNWLMLIVEILVGIICYLMGLFILKASLLIKIKKFIEN